MEVIVISTIMGERLWRIRNPVEVVVNMVSSDCFRPCVAGIYNRCRCVFSDCGVCKVLKGLIIVLAFIGNPCWVLFFLTPVPYALLFARGCNAATRRNIIKSLMAWILICSAITFCICTFIFPSILGLWKELYGLYALTTITLIIQITWIGSILETNSVNQTSAV